MATRDFATIEADYDFFRAHATEEESGLRDYGRELESFRGGRRSIRMLDFGCGTGGFTARFLSSLDWPPPRLELALVEPAHRQRQRAVARLGPFSDRPVAAASGLPSVAAPPFDLILSNHVLYFVDDLDRSVRRLADLLATGGLMLLAMAGRDNVLVQLWEAGFSMAGRPVPYNTAEDVEAALGRAGKEMRRSTSPYRIRFPDSPENRMKILRFLFGPDLDEMPRDRLLGAFDRFASGDRIEVATRCHHFAVPGIDPPNDPTPRARGPEGDAP